MPHVPDLRGGLLSDLAAIEQRIARSASESAAQESLDWSEKRYRYLVENSLGLICTHDLDGIVLSVNPAAASSLGYEPRDGIGRNLREFLSPGTRASFRSLSGAHPRARARQRSDASRPQGRYGAPLAVSQRPLCRARGAPLCAGARHRCDRARGGGSRRPTKPRTNAGGDEQTCRSCGSCLQQPAHSDHRQRRNAHRGPNQPTRGRGHVSTRSCGRRRVALL